VNDDRDWDLWINYKAAWRRAERLQERCDDASLLFGVVYDMQRGAWLPNCVDTSRWITEQFHGGHRAYYTEVWREH